ncbi:MAG TPA: CAP domain-containing protein [Candidatus Limnocylindria bacterium]|nr:CAP domain-containing protein [Candidatus Limnocylindria bacterium]
MARTIAMLLAALLITAVTLAATAPVRAAGGDGLREAANGYRQEHGLDPVIGTALLDDIATRRAARMARDNTLEHDMAYVSQRLNDSGVCWSAFGEIIAWENYPDYSADRVVRLWWDSDKGHHEIMMGEGYNAAGGAWDTAGDGGHYSVMVFVTLCGQSVAGEPGSVLYPDDRYDPHRELVLYEGRITAYRLNRSGDVLSQKVVKPSKTLHLSSSGRTRANGKAWLKVSSGVLAGYWVRETSHSFVRGLTQRDSFEPDKHVTLERGRYLGLRFDWLGRIKASKTYTFGHERTVSASAHAVINGRHYLMLSSGPLAGYWLRDTPQVQPA